MSKQNETKFKERVFRRLDEVYPRAWYFKVQAGSVRGIPDVVGLVDGCFFAFELKVKEGEEGDQFPLQKYHLSKINEALGFARVVYPDTFEDALVELRQHVRSLTS